MATYDLTASTTATGRPSRMNPGVRTPYLVENIVDISKAVSYTHLTLPTIYSV